MFRDARLKIDRANKHIAEVESLALSLERDYASSIEVQEKTGGQSIKYECPDFGDRLIDIALATGDAIHNLRTALDYAWVETIDRLKLPQTKFRKFPFRETPKMLDDALTGGEIDQTSPALFKKITTDIKPYRAGNIYLWALHDFDITDKHKLLLPIVDCTSAVSVSVEDEKGVTYEISSMPRFGSMGLIYLDFFPNIKIKDNGHIAISILFPQGSALDGCVIPHELHMLAHSALGVVRSLESIPL